jgi:hypothetical protein
MKALVCGGRGFSDADRMTAIMDAAVNAALPESALESTT